MPNALTLKIKFGSTENISLPNKIKIDEDLFLEQFRYQLPIFGGG